MPDHPSTAVPRAVIVHGLDHARAALAAAAEQGVAVALFSPPAAAASHGPLWFARLDAAMRSEARPPALFVLDCAAAPGHALAALRHGLRDISLEAPPDVIARLALMGLRVHPRPARALDLLDDPDPLSACRAWLAGD